MNLNEIKKLTQKKEIKYTKLSTYKKRNLIFNLEIFYDEEKLLNFNQKSIANICDIYDTFKNLCNFFLVVNSDILLEANDLVYNYDIFKNFEVISDAGIMYLLESFRDSIYIINNEKSLSSFNKKNGMIIKIGEESHIFNSYKDLNELANFLYKFFFNEEHKAATLFIDSFNGYNYPVIINNASKLDFNFLNISAVLNIDRVKLKILAKKFAGMHNFTASYEFIDKNNNSFLFNKFLKISFPNNIF